MLKFASLVFAAALTLSAGVAPVLAFEGGQHGGPGNQGNGDGQGNGPGGNGGGENGSRDGPNNFGRNAGVPGPVEGVGLPFLLAGGAAAVAAAFTSRKREGVDGSTDPSV